MQLLIDLKETNLECQETLEVCEPVCMRYDGMFCTFYHSLECRHPDSLAALRSVTCFSLSPLPSMQSFHVKAFPRS